MMNIIDGSTEDRGQHVTGFDRWQLIGITEQDQLRTVVDGFDQLAHQRQIHHRGFIDHHDVEGQRVVGVMAETWRVRDHPEQAVQRAGIGGQGRKQPGIDALRRHLRGGTVQAFGHAIGGTTGGCGQGHARRRAAGLQRLGDAQHQQARDRGGLAGAGATGDEQQCTPQCKRGGAGLAVVVASVGEQAGEQRRERGAAGIRHRLRGDALQLQCKPAFVFAIAAQVEQAVFEDERGGFGGGVRCLRGGHETRGRKLLHPGRHIGPGDVGIDQLPWRGGIERGVTMRDGERCQRGGGQHVVRRGGIEPAQGLRQCFVQRTQRTDTLEFAQQAHAVAPSARPNSASSACTSSGAKRCAWMPGDVLLPASRPRQNR